MLSFRPLDHADLPTLHTWLCLPHVSEWWGPPPALAAVEQDYAPLLAPASATQGYIALLHGHSLGFVQCYVVKGSGEGWWEDEVDPGARGIDQFLAHPEHLGRGLGSAMVRAFVDGLFRDPQVTQVQADPAPGNRRAIRCYLHAGFRAHGEVTTPDGPALLMRRRRDTPASLGPAR